LMLFREIVGKSVVSLLIVAACLTPFWLWLAAYELLDPGDFWQKFLTVGIGIWVLGGFQIVSLVTMLGLLISLWDS